DTFISDKDPAVAAAVAIVYPTTRHILCLHHMLGNIADHLRPAAQGQGGWDRFLKLFWAAYRAVSPEAFEDLWGTLVAEFPGCRAYLDEELYPIRRQWAWAWVVREFTAGIRTNGRVEAENRVNKLVGGAKTTAFGLFLSMNDRSCDQCKNEMMAVRQTARHKHEADIEQIFPGPLAMLRAYCGPFAIQTCYREMQLSVFYLCEALKKPQGRETEPWVSNDISDDHAYVVLHYVLLEVQARRLTIRAIFKIRHLSTGAIHYVVVLTDNRVICDCGKLMNVGVICRHIARVFQDLRDLPFHISIIR
ncbi:hypothetical protein SCHPADRAFT_795290, partial [Schizopora paradoxa]